MAVIIDINRTVDHVLKRELNKPDPTIYVLGVISSTVLAQIDDFSTSYKRSSVNPAAQAELVFNTNVARIEYVKKGLRNIKPLTDKDGQSVEFNKDVIDKLPLKDLYELGDEIKIINKTSEEEEKN